MATKKKIVISASALLMLAVVLTTVFCTIFATPTFAAASEYDENAEGETVLTTVDDFEMESEEPTHLSLQMVGSPMLLAGVNNTVSVSKTVKATVSPATAKNTNVSWTVDWEDPSHTGTVTDYVTVTPIAAGSTTATVTCYQPFTGNIIVTVTTEESGFTADCVVSFVGYPDEIVMTTNLTPSGTNEYKIGINNQNKFNLSVKNVFGQVGDDFKALNVTVTGHGQVEVGSHEVYRGGGSNWLGVETVDLSTIQDGLITYTYSNGFLTVKALKSIESYYESSSRMDGGRTTCYENAVKSIVSECYFTVTISEPTTGITKEFKLFFDDAIVNGVSVDTPALKF